MELLWSSKKIAYYLENLGKEQVSKIIYRKEKNVLENICLVSSEERQEDLKFME